MIIALQRYGKRGVDFFWSIRFFFQFLGHLTYTLIYNFRRIAWKHTLAITMGAGSSLVLPLMIVSVLIAIFMALSIHNMLSMYNIQNKALNLIQDAVIRDIAPMPIGFVLCVHCSFNLIDKEHPSLHKSPQIVLRETIIPLIVGINFNAVLLYTYVIFAFFVGTYFTFHTLVHANMDEYLLRLNESIKPSDVLLSVAKTMLLATIASFIAGYYYYDVAIRVLPVRLAVSRIITRGLLWLVVFSVLLKIYIAY